MGVEKGLLNVEKMRKNFWAKKNRFPAKKEPKKRKYGANIPICITGWASQFVSKRGHKRAKFRAKKGRNQGQNR